MNISSATSIQPLDNSTIKTTHSGISESSLTKEVANSSSEVKKVTAKNSEGQDISRALEEINKKLQDLSVGIEFSTDEDTKKTIVKVIDTQTKDVIRQFPSETVLEITKAIDKLQGILVNEKA